MLCHKASVFSEALVQASFALPYMDKVETDSAEDGLNYVFRFAGHVFGDV